MDDDFAEIIGVSCPDEKAYIADFAFVFWLAPEAIFLYIGHALHKEAECEQYHPCDISSGAESGLREFGHVGGIQNGDW